MQLSPIHKIFSQFLAKFRKRTSNSEHFEKIDEPHS